MAANSPKTVCLTGADGFLGLHITKLLLERGYKVHATTIAERHAAPIRALHKRIGGDLTIFLECDLMKKGAFDDAIKGCDVVLHTASPFFWGGTYDELVKPALEGTRNVLDACIRFGVKEVVLTASTASVYAMFGTKPVDYVFSSKDWSPEDLCIENDDLYALSKTKAERLAWEMAEGNFQLSTINPGLIFGSMVDEQKHMNTSSKTIFDYASGKKDTIANKCTNIVDVREVALAHILAFEKGVWGERFLLVAGCPSWKNILEIASKHVPDASQMPTKLAPVAKTVYGAPYPNPTKMDTTPSTEKLGIVYRPIEESIADNIESAVKKFEM